MITLLREGLYKLIETKRNIKVLYLDDEVYAWVEPAEIGEILVMSHNPHKTDYILSTGSFKLYDAKDEPYLSDQLHMELEVGKNIWQGYLLLSGLPTDQKKRTRIVPTAETITGNPKLKRKKEFLKI